VDTVLIVAGFLIVLAVMTPQIWRQADSLLAYIVVLRRHEMALRLAIDPDATHESGQAQTLY
jgi:hypothetical protein